MSECPILAALRQAVKTQFQGPEGLAAWEAAQRVLTQAETVPGDLIGVRCGCLTCKDNENAA